MPSEYVKDLVDHKQRVAKYMQLVAKNLLERVVERGDVLPFTLETDEPLTLMYMIDVACKLKRDEYGADFQLSEQVSVIVQNTLAYLSYCEDGTPCHWIAYCIEDLFQRAAVHDNSKYSPEEFDAYDRAFSGLQKYAYGTDEFKAELAKIKPAIAHHYRVNDHHPEFFLTSGIDEMNFVQLIEMTCDWIAASERSQADIYKGLEMNRQRFGIDEQLFSILKNTVEYLKEG